jgi:hypothetical protein
MTGSANRSYTYFSGSQWRFYASGSYSRGNPLSALPENAAAG